MNHPTWLDRLLFRLQCWWRGVDPGGWRGSRGSTRHRDGWVAEDFAVADLTGRGYHILGRNVELKGGEIDIVAEHGRRLVFVEVRSRREDSPIRPASTLTKAKERRILRLGRQYCRKRRVEPEIEPRYDIAEVYVNADGRPVRCDVLVNAVRDPDRR